MPSTGISDTLKTSTESERLGFLPLGFLGNRLPSDLSPTTESQDRSRGTTHIHPFIQLHAPDVPGPHYFITSLDPK